MILGTVSEIEYYFDDMGPKTQEIDVLYNTEPFRVIKRKNTGCVDLWKCFKRDDGVGFCALAENESTWKKGNLLVRAVTCFSDYDLPIRLKLGKAIKKCFD